MSACPAHIARLCHTRLTSHLKRSPEVLLPLPIEQVEAQLAQIARYNFDSGRFARLCKHRKTPATLTPARYVDFLIEHWLAEYARVQRLADRNDREWERLRVSLRRSAARILGQLGQAPSVENAAEDYAQRACARIFESRFPFDVAFDAWAQTILRRLMLEQYRSADVLDQAHQSIDAPSSFVRGGADMPAEGIEIPDRTMQTFLTALEDRDFLDRALAQLGSEVQRQVIRLTYFEEQSDVQISARLGKTVANIQTLRHRALEHLREIILVKEKPRKKHQSK